MLGVGLTAEEMRVASERAAKEEAGAVIARDSGRKARVEIKRRKKRDAIVGLGDDVLPWRNKKRRARLVIAG